MVDPTIEPIKFNLDIVKMGDTLLIESDGKFFSRGIELKQLSRGFEKKYARFTHAEISGGGHRSMRIAPPRATRIDITKVYAGKRIQIRRYIDDDWERKRKHVAWVHATLCNSAYDNTGILGFLTTWFKQHASRWFCSEGWLFSIRTEYPLALGGLPPHKCMPAHAARSPELETIWEGVLPI